jgi:dTDP-4-dehydrorhamnose 3,5-epimerase
MIFHETTIPGAWIIEPQRLEDERGFFARSWCADEFQRRGLNARLVQCNISYNRQRGTWRGLHFQIAPHQEEKLVRCTQGAIFDVLVDLRPSSSTYLRWSGFELTTANRKQLYVPSGVAHGFLTLADDSELLYQMSQYHEPTAARGLRWDDPAIAMELPEPVKVISLRDRNYPDFQAALIGAEAPYARASKPSSS